MMIMMMIHHHQKQPQAPSRSGGTFAGPVGVVPGGYSVVTLLSCPEFPSEISSPMHSKVLVFTGFAHQCPNIWFAIQCPQLRLLDPWF